MTSYLGISKKFGSWSQKMSKDKKGLFLSLRPQIWSRRCFRYFKEPFLRRCLGSFSGGSGKDQGELTSFLLFFSGGFLWFFLWFLVECTGTAESFFHSRVSCKVSRIFEMCNCLCMEICFLAISKHDNQQQHLQKKWKLKPIFLEWIIAWSFVCFAGTCCDLLQNILIQVSGTWIVAHIQWGLLSRINWAEGLC